MIRGNVAILLEWRAGHSCVLECTLICFLDIVIGPRKHLRYVFFPSYGIWMIIRGRMSWLLIILSRPNIKADNWRIDRALLEIGRGKKWTDVFRCWNLNNTRCVSAGAWRPPSVTRTNEIFEFYWILLWRSSL